MVGFWFGVGVILAVDVVDGLTYVVGAFMSNNEITNKMSEQTQVDAPNVEAPLKVTRKDPKKVAQSERLVEWNRRNKKKSWPRQLKLRRANLIEVKIMGLELS